MKTCGKKTEVYSRVTGYFRPVSNWNDGKKEEFRNRRNFELSLTGPGGALKGTGPSCAAAGERRMKQDPAACVAPQ
jgi:ribonucleoside-triphosphate reductase